MEPRKTSKGWKIETDKGADYFYLEKVESELVPLFGDNVVYLNAGYYALQRVKRNWKKVNQLTLAK